MKPVKRMGVSKGKSAQSFRRQTRYTKAANVRVVPRGGIRL